MLTPPRGVDFHHALPARRRIAKSHVRDLQKIASMEFADAKNSNLLHLKPHLGDHLALTAFLNQPIHLQKDS
jgi:hypothetical protein